MPDSSVLLGLNRVAGSSATGGWFFQAAPSAVLHGLVVPCRREHVLKVPVHGFRPVVLKATAGLDHQLPLAVRAASPIFNEFASLQASRVLRVAFEPTLSDCVHRPRRSADPMSCAKAGRHDEGEGWAGSGNRWGAVPEPCETRRNLGAHLGREPESIVSAVVGVRQDSLVFPPACQHGRTHSWHIT